jgi:hypothetical protein
LDTRMDRLDTRIDDMEAGQTAVRVELMARMDRLQDSLTAIRDDIGVNMGAADGHMASTQEFGKQGSRDHRRPMTGSAVRNSSGLPPGF